MTRVCDKLIMKSVFITGASGVGKSTTYHGLIDHGFAPSPSYITRPRRDSEHEGIDAYFISTEQFATNMAAGFFLESTMSDAEYGGVYYGSPVQWEIDALSGSLFAAIPSNVISLRGLMRRFDDRNMRSSVLWVNLYASLETRRERVLGYISDPDQIQNRLYAGVGQGTKLDADINIDTGEHKVDQVLDAILELTNGY